MVDTEPQDEDRHERDLGRRKAERHQRVERPMRPFRPRHPQAGEHAEDHRERKPGKGAIKTYQQRRHDLALE